MAAVCSTADVVAQKLEELKQVNQDLEQLVTGFVADYEAMASNYKTLGQQLVVEYATLALKTKQQIPVNVVTIAAAFGADLQQ